MRTLPVDLPGLVFIEPDVYPDERGFFCETYRASAHEQLGIPSDDVFVQDNHSRPTRGVLRL
jgi:dTDP-4-dehydrorhamnose 3,5-epimerase